MQLRQDAEVALVPLLVKQAVHLPASLALTSPSRLSATWTQHAPHRTAQKQPVLLLQLVEI